MKFKIIILVLSCNIFVLALEKDQDLQKIVSEFGYGISSEYVGQLSHSMDIFYVVVKFQLPKLNDIFMIFRKIPVGLDT